MELQPPNTFSSATLQTELRSADTQGKEKKGNRTQRAGMQAVNAYHSMQQNLPIPNIVFPRCKDHNRRLSRWLLHGGRKVDGGC